MEQRFPVRSTRDWNMTDTIPRKKQEDIILVGRHHFVICPCRSTEGHHSSKVIIAVRICTGVQSKPLQYLTAEYIAVVWQRCRFDSDRGLNEMVLQFNGQNLGFRFLRYAFDSHWDHKEMPSQLNWMSTSLRTKRLGIRVPPGVQKICTCGRVVRQRSAKPSRELIAPRRFDSCHVLQVWHSFCNIDRKQ